MGNGAQDIPYDPSLYGDIASWVGSIGSIVAVAIAAFVFLRESRQARLALKNADDQLRATLEQWDFERFQTRSSQSSKISGWIDVVSPDEKTSLRTPHDDELLREWSKYSDALKETTLDQASRRAAAQELDRMRERFGETGPKDALWAISVFENKSGQPVYDVKFEAFQLFQDERMPMVVATAPIWTPDSPRLEFRVTSEENDNTFVRPDDRSAFLGNSRASITFTDSSGVRWLRRPEGDLKEL